MATPKAKPKNIKHTVSLPLDNSITLQDLQDFIGEAKALGAPMDTVIPNPYDYDEFRVTV